MKKTVLVTGNFNVLHPGHIRLLKFAKTFAKTLIVGVFSDELAGRAVDVPQDLRHESVASINIVDQSFLISSSLSDFIKSQKPDVIVKGKEFEGQYNQEADLIDDYGGELVFSSGEIGFSANINLEDQLSIPPTTKWFIKSFSNRHKISTKSLKRIINKFSKLKVCVIGDVMVDQYIDCFPLGMSQEEPTLVVSPQETKNFLGGAGIVASHAAQLGASVRFLSVVGHDQVRDLAATELDRFNVDYSFVVDTTRPTTLKQRFRSHGRSLLRVSTLSQQAISDHLQRIILSEFEQAIGGIDVVVFSDFNYGCLPQSLVDRVIEICKNHNVMISADSQSSSQFGDVSRFKGANLITPTEREARLALQNFDDGLVVLADKLMAKTSAQNILLKLGVDGMIAQLAQKQDLLPHTERLDALNLNPVDVSGAGDSVLITASLALAVGATLWQASLLGSIAAFIQVGRVGNIPITSSEITQVLS
jgi:rfaE bifunctional protein kinase chain/domain